MRIPKVVRKHLFHAVVEISHCVAYVVGLARTRAWPRARFFAFGVGHPTWRSVVHEDIRIRVPETCFCLKARSVRLSLQQTSFFILAATT